jgi:hypothetical protein
MWCGMHAIESGLVLFGLVFFGFLPLLPGKLQTSKSGS